MIKLGVPSRTWSLFSCRVEIESDRCHCITAVLFYCCEQLFTSAGNTCVKKICKGAKGKLVISSEVERR